MRNRLDNPFDDSNATSAGDAAWQLDQNPHLRVGAILAVFLLPLLVVFGRLVFLQVSLGEEFATLRSKFSEAFEAIPTRDGRILSGEGRILAEDVETFRVLVHYRWLEEPPNKNWLRQLAYGRLSRQERRDDQLVEQTQLDILRERSDEWGQLAAACGLTPLQFETTREAIQRRVERIREHVENRRQASKDSSPRIEAAPNQPWWWSLWTMFVEALTTPPQRTVYDPLVIQEELDYHAIAEDVPLSVAALLESQAQRFPGIRIQVATRRQYPAGNFAPHVVGYRTLANPDELKKEPREESPRIQRSAVRIGRTGVERSYDRQLRGQPGLRRIIRNNQGEIVRSETVREPRLGRDAVLTLDSHLQDRAAELLDSLVNPSDHRPTTDPSHDENEVDSSLVPTGGCLVAINVHTGAVLAAASAPDFDLRILDGSNPEAWNHANNDPRHPFFFRATSMALPPGSVFKTLTSIALLQSGQIEPHDTIYCRGYLDEPDRHRCYIFRHYGVGHHEMNLSDALCQSCNVYFFGAAREVGPQPLISWADRFGFGRPTGIDLPGEVDGSLPRPPASKESGQNDGRWYPGDTLGLAIGQSRLTVTPIQIARMMAAVANGGYLVTPHVVSRTVQLGRNSEGDDSQESINLDSSFRWVEPQRIPDLREETLATVREGLEKVVANPKGTGYKRVRLESIAIAGKTGTAEVGGGKADHAWFAGYVPAENPRIAFVVVLEHAGSGGAAAGPVARQFVQAMLDTELIHPQQMTVRK